MLLFLNNIDWISLSTSLAALATAVATIFMVIEMKKQRENVYTPHLFIDKANFYVQGVKLNNIYMASIWHNNSKDAAEPIDFDPTSRKINRFFIKCHNIGFGTAKDVSVNFSYNIDEFINQINKIENCVSEDLMVDVVNNDKFITILPKSNKLPYNGFGVSSDMGLIFNPGHILPVSINQTFVSIELPMVFLELISVYNFYKSNIRPLMINDNGIPVLRMNINYTDLFNKKVLKSFKLRTKINLLGTIVYYGEFIASEEESTEI